MLTLNRPYSELANDFDRMWRFLEQENAHRQGRFIWQLGRLGDWKYGLWTDRKFFPSFLRKNAQLWLDPMDQLAGFAISENGDNMFTIFTRFGCEYLFQEIALWIINHWSDREGGLWTEIHQYQEAEMRTLERLGFQNQGLLATTREYDLGKKAGEPIELDPEFRLVDMTIAPDYRGLRSLQKHAFRQQDTVTEIDLLAYEYSRESPCYRPHLDLAIVNRAGQHVAACLAFVDYANAVAEVERVCSHSDYRRRGLTEAVIRSCFQRLRRDGIGIAYLTGFSDAANGLYEKLGPDSRKSWFNYAQTARQANTEIYERRILPPAQSARGDEVAFACGEVI